MHADALRSIFPLLHEHLYVADVFRLSHALSYRHTEWPREDVAHVRRRLAVPPRVDLGVFLCTYVARKRCRQCGMTCYALLPRFCQHCTRYDRTSPVLLVDRCHVHHHYKPPRLARRILATVSMVKRGGNGAHLYWKRDVEACATWIAESTGGKRRRSSGSQTDSPRAP